MERTVAAALLDREAQRWSAERAQRDRESSGLEVESAVGSAVQAGDRSDLAAATRAWHEDREFSREAEAALEEIEAARIRLAKGTYGTCERCGARIGDERLEAVPATRFCVAHA